MNDFNKIYGYATAKKELAQIADYLRNPGRYDVMGARMSAGLLISGEPGLGKTLMADCLIDASGLPSVTCRKTKQGGDMLDQIHEAFASAVEAAPSILLLDDVDKFSNSDYDLCDTEEYVTIQSCIDESKGKGVFVVATANDANKLPKSLLREGRFDHQIRLAAPVGHDALEITRHYLERAVCSDSVDARDVTDIVEGYSCALIETVVNEASLLAGFERAPVVELVHFIRAFARVRGEGELSELPGAASADIDAEWASERSQAAYHEAGHIVLDELLRPGGASIAVLIESQGSLLGLAKQRNISSRNTIAEEKKDMLIGLAGSVAVERKFGIPCMGCESDNLKVAEKAGRLLKDAALLGSYYVGKARWRGSEFHDGATERACAALVELCRWEVRELLARNWKAVERIANELYLKGYILPADIASAVGKKSGACTIARDKQVA